MTITELLQPFLPHLPPARRAALNVELVRARAAEDRITKVAEVLDALVEDLADVDAKAARPRLTQKAGDTLARLVTLAREARVLLDRVDRLDQLDAVREARGAGNDAAFSAKMSIVKREVTRLESRAATMERSQAAITISLGELVAMAESGTLYSTAFTVTPPAFEPRLTR